MSGNWDDIVNYTCGECGREYPVASDALDCETQDKHPGMTLDEARVAEDKKWREWLAKKEQER